MRFKLASRRPCQQQRTGDRPSRSDLSGDRRTPTGSVSPDRLTGSGVLVWRERSDTPGTFDLVDEATGVAQPDGDFDDAAMFGDV